MSRVTRRTARINPATGLWGTGHASPLIPIREKPGRYLGVRPECTDRRRPA